MALLNDLRNLLEHHLRHVNAQPNSGTAHLIERHLKALESAADDADAHKVLGELYGALNAPAPEAPAEPAAPAKAPAKKTVASAADANKA